MDPADSNQLIMSSSASSPGPQSALSSTSSASTVKARPGPLHLQPPTGINILPPSPIDPRNGSPFSSSPVEVESPESTSDTEEQAPRDKSRSRLTRLSAHALSTLPTKAHCLLLSPQISRTISNDSSGSASSTGTLGSRAPTPSSPGYRPKRTHHRRTSSTHRVRETVDGEQKTTAEGRLVNQYRIGKSLGKGAYAKVELGVDITTGTEYAIKEYSKSRLSYQALQERQRQSTRSRLRKAQRRRDRGLWSKLTGDDGLGAAAGATATPVSSGPWAIQEDRGDDPLGLIRREIAVMKKLDHPNIVHLYEAISVPDADALFLVLEYLPGGTLMDVQVGGDTSNAQPPFPLEQAREYFRQLCLGLEYLHHNEVVHRDIKPDNVLLSADREIVKLCDFGVSEMFFGSGDDRIKHTGGSPAFLSPESFQSNTSDVHGKAVDIWALGVTLYCMLTGKLPFNVENPIELFEMVKTQEPDIPDDWDPDLRDLMIRFLNKNPTERIRMLQIREHPWVTMRGDEEMITKDDNLYYVGSQVEEPTQEELGLAIRPLKGIFTLIRAVQKMRRLGHLRRSISGLTSGSSVPSGSMDSYATTSTVSEGTSTSPTEISDADRLKAGDVQSPLSISGGSEMDDELIDDLKLDPSVDSPGLRETLRQGLRDLKIETSQLHHRPSLTRLHRHVDRPDSTHRHTHHIHRLKHHIHRHRRRDVEESTESSASDSDATPAQRRVRAGKPSIGHSTGDQHSSSRVGDESPNAPDVASYPSHDEVEITDSPVEENEVQITDSPVEDDGKIQITDSPIDGDDFEITDSPVEDAEFQITDSPVPDRPDAENGIHEPVTIMESPTAL